MQNLLWKRKETRYFEEIYWSHCWKSHKILFKVDHHSWISTKSLWKCSWSSRCRQIIGWRVLFGWQNIRSEENKISKQFCFLLTRNQERKHLGYLKIRWQQLCFLNGKDQIRHQLDQVDLSYTNFSPELVSILVYLYILYLLSFYYHFKSFYCYHFFSLSNVVLKCFFETLLGLNTYCFIILIFKVLKIINCQINYMIIATAFSKIFVFL